jgi:hypothetical protein
MTSFERSQDDDGSGYYAPSSGAVVVSYKNIRSLDNATQAGAGSPLIGQNQFDETVRHEVGHAVDQQYGLSAAYCIGQAAGGAWTSEAPAGVAARMVTASAGAISALPAAEQAAVVAALQRVVNTRSPGGLHAGVRTALSHFHHGAALTQAVTAAMADNAVKALRVCFSDMRPGNPWYLTDESGGVALGGRIFEESYAAQWWSYDSSARARRVSLYQFRAPGEWIAEAYNAYYAPPTKGAALNAKDPAAKVWFDVHVDQRTGGQGAAGAGPSLPPAASGPGFPAPPAHGP